MTETEFRKIFEGTGWDVVYENDAECAQVRLKSGQTVIAAGTTWPDRGICGEDLREMTFRNAALDLGGRPRPNYKSWSFPAWLAGGKVIKTPDWCKDPNNSRPCVGSVEEFALKLSAFSEV